MDAFRYYVALVLTALMPPVLLYWGLLHPWVRFWRRLGPIVAMTLLWSAVGLAAAGLFSQRAWLLAVDFGTNPVVFGAGVIFIAAAAWLRRRLALHFGFRTLAGLPEVAPERYPQRLVTQGLHARVRHPRYLQMLLGLLGWSLVANHPASYAAAALWLPGVWAIVLFEERELRQRFGREYDEYSRKVPRFVPRLFGD